MLTIDRATLSLGGRDLLVDASWQVHPGERVGLMGPNGSGKTSLLRVIIGELDLERGAVTLRPGLALGYLRQQPPSRGERPLWDEARASMSRLARLESELAHAEAAVTGGDSDAAARLAEATERFRLAGGYAAEERVGEVLHGLGFRKEDWSRPCSAFSGGWQVRIELACLLLSEPELLLLDEPTNHLDMAARSWLAGFLAGYRHAIVVVSHDRFLLDRACNRVAELHGGRLLAFKGDLQGWMKERDLLLARERVAWESQQKEIARLQRFIDKNRAKAALASQARSRQRALDRMALVEAPTKERKAPRFRLPRPEPVVSPPVSLSQACIGWPDAEPLFPALDLAIEPGSRLALLGPNGCGKSTLLKALAGLLPLRGGRRRVAEGVRIGVFSQEAARDLEPGLSGLDQVLARAPAASPEQVRGVLGALGLSGDAALRPIRSLSGGERARVVLAVFALRRHDLLLLDEPTNHLDAVTVGVLADALAAFPGTVVVATHDRYLVERIATHVGRVGEGGIALYQGVLTSLFEPSRMRGDGPAGTEVGGAEGAEAHAERKRRARERDRMVKRIEAIQVELEAQESEQLALDGAMVEAATDFPRLRALTEARQGLEDRCAALYGEWEELEAALEPAEGQLPVPR
jgi:ATP-binding cassette subfamily F protein 3